MQKIAAMDPEKTSGKTKELFQAVEAKLGMVPNMMRTMGNSPAVLNAYLAFSSALGESALGPKLAEQIALTVANANGCEYCNAAHSYIGTKLLKLDEATVEAARQGKAKEPNTTAALTFARKLVATKGEVTEQDIAVLRTAGYNDAAVAEIIAHTALNIFTNYFNKAAGVVIDFPQAELSETAAI